MTGVAEAFSAHAGDYDRLRRALVPCFDRFYGTAVELVALAVPPDARVVDLGAGTGLLSALVIERLPRASLHLVDVAEGMLEQARWRLAGRQVSFEVADYAAAPLGGPWDAVMSGLSIHHLEDAAKRELLRRINQALRPGGVFVNAEQVVASSPALAAREHAMWRREALAHGASAADVMAAEARMRHDRCATLEAQLQWLREAGFRDVDCAFKHWRFAVYSGSR